jgi:hypothetical protein
MGAEKQGRRTIKIFSPTFSHLQPYPDLFRISPLASLKSAFTFAFPNGNRPTGNLDKTAF